MDLHNFVQPFIYLVFVLMLPMATPAWAILLIGFFTGLLIDTDLGTAGMHAASATLIAFVRPFALSILAPQGGYPKDALPTLLYQKFGWYIRYALPLIFLHHLVYFFLEIFSLNGFFNTLSNVFLSTIISFVLIVGFEFLFNRQTPREIYR